VQQLRDGVANFFATFIEVRKDRTADKFEVEPGVTSGDYLQGFLRGTRAALYEGERDSMTVSISQVDAFHVGALIALYERAVGFYGSLVNVNAYHQPGVEAGKKAATRILDLQPKVLAQLRKNGRTAEEIAQAIEAEPEDVYHVLRHLAANDSTIETSGRAPGEEKFSRR
jgi:glucose-6-phosphate isomerase